MPPPIFHLSPPACEHCVYDKLGLTDHRDGCPNRTTRPDWASVSRRDRDVGRPRSNSSRTSTAATTATPSIHVHFHQHLEVPHVSSSRQQTYIEEIGPSKHSSRPQSSARGHKHAERDLPPSRRSHQHPDQKRPDISYSYFEPITPLSSDYWRARSNLGTKGHPQRTRETESDHHQHEASRASRSRPESFRPTSSSTRPDQSRRDHESRGHGSRDHEPRDHGSRSHESRDPGSRDHKSRGYKSRGKTSLNPIKEASLPDYYAILGITSGASSDEIKKAARKMRIDTHPDKLKTPGMSSDKNEALDRRAAEVGQAADVLMDPIEKKKYDKSRHAEEKYF